MLLSPEGGILDDLIITKHGEDEFYVVTNAGCRDEDLAYIAKHLDAFNKENVSNGYTEHEVMDKQGLLALQGPKARDLLAPLVDGLDISAGAFPHMSVADCTVGGLPARLFRVSFTGELGFEINVPARHGRALWELLMAAGAAHGITPYGTEAMHVMRAEKGYIIVGQDTDGTVTPDDAGLSWAIGKAKADFVGKRSLARPDMALPDRKQLVGLLTEDPAVVLEEGAQIVADPNQPKPMTMLGHVTSSYLSPALGRSIALALVAGGRAREGQTLHIPMPDRVIPAKVTTAMVFVDPDGVRLSV